MKTVQWLNGDRAARLKRVITTNDLLVIQVPLVAISNFPHNRMEP